MVNNAATKLSRRFGKGGGRKIHDIVKTEILQDILHTTYEIRVEKTQNKFSYISPYWSPFTMINGCVPRQYQRKRKVVLMRQQVIVSSRIERL